MPVLSARAAATARGHGGSCTSAPTPTAAPTSWRRSCARCETSATRSSTSTRSARARTLRAGHVDFSSEARGGYGPIYIRLASIEPILARFAPQVIVCSAGGLCFHPGDAIELKRRGIVLLGVTLSDPDVFASVVPAASTFDYHTTNARDAVAMYRAAGVRNTSWLPFGIDRDYVLADVPEAPDMVADVICLGHAKGRTERNETMRRLAEAHDVRVYGTGWELPGAEVVRDVRQQQAAAQRPHPHQLREDPRRPRQRQVRRVRGDRLRRSHLHVAVRRDGGVLRVRPRDRRVRGADDLVDTVRDLLADPDRLERIRRAAFQRLVREHLYEHRWLKLFADIERDLTAPDGMLTPERAEIVAATLAADDAAPPPRGRLRLLRSVATSVTTCCSGR